MLLFLALFNQIPGMKFGLLLLNQLIDWLAFFPYRSLKIKYSLKSYELDEKQTELGYIYSHDNYLRYERKLGTLR